MELNSGRHSNFCADSFWDSSISWNTSTPEFTECFQETMFVLAPCCFFWTSAVAYITLNLKRPRDHRLPWSLTLSLEIALCAILICISIAELSLVVHGRRMHIPIADVELYSNSVKIIAYVLVLCVLIVNRFRGITSSSLLTVFLFILSLCGIFVLISSVRHTFNKEQPSLLRSKYVLATVYFPILFVQFLLSLIPKAKGNFSNIEEKNPVEEAPFFSYITFFWLFRYIIKGAKKLLTVDDFPPLPSKLTASYIWKAFKSKWNSWTHHRPIDDLLADDSPTHNAGFVCVLLRAFWPHLTYTFVCHFFSTFLMFVPALLLYEIILFISAEDYMWKGYFFCLVLFVADYIKRIFFSFMWFHSACFSLQIKSALTSAIYRKSMKLSTSARKKYTSGEMLNLMSVDVEKIAEFCTICTFVIESPLKIIISISGLWLILGPSCLAGIAVLFVIIVSTSLLSRKTTKVQVEQMEEKDSRLKLVTEVLNGIKVLKLYAWEIPFMKKINKIRNEEVKCVRTFQIHFAVNNFVWGCSAALIAVACFVTYTLVDNKHILRPHIVFVALNLLAILRYGALDIPELIANVVQTIVSLKRINTFLRSGEFNEDVVGTHPDDGELVSIRSASFSWGPKEEPTLRDINFHAPKGSFIAVIGPVGSGKSSLLSAILGEMYKSAGTVDVDGTFAYVPQQAWILHETIKENILFVKQLDRKLYNDVLDGCCLRPDLEILPGGDNTEIGEKGVNLSGGQKQRVSLARAVYQDADIYLLDDPLSAVDSHVGKHIFEHVIGNNGLLKHKTRILVTHNIGILSKADCIYTMRDGQIEEKGTYDDLLQHGGLFSELIQEYANVASADDAVDDSVIMTDLEGASSSRPVVERTQSTSLKRRRNTSVESETSYVGAQLVEEERMEIGEVKREAFLEYIKHMGYPLFFAMLIGFLGHQALDIGGNFWLTAWSQEPVLPDGTQDTATRNKYMGVYIAFGLCQGAAALFGSISRAFGAARASKLLHLHMLESIMKTALTYFDTTPLGRIINRFGHDIDEIDTGIPLATGLLLGVVCSAIGIFIVISINTPIFLAFLIPVALLYCVVQKLYITTSRQLKRLSAVTRSPIYSHFSETIQGTSSIKAYKVTNEFIEKSDELLDIHILCQFYWYACIRWLEINLGFIGDIIILIASSLIVSSGKDAAIVGLTLTYALSVNEILNFLVFYGTELENKAVSVERVVEYSRLPSEAPWTIPDYDPPPSWPHCGQIEFKNYSTRYRKDLDLVLNDISVKISDGEKVGVVGRTGAGKSSFTLALFRILEPASGNVNIDNVDVSKIGLHQLRSKLTIIPQDPVLFAGRLRGNLDPNDQYSDNELWSSLEHASLKTFVKSLATGLDHEVTEGGGNLSVGQRQLICLARALLKSTKILILDEATAAVDVETDALIQKTIRTEFKDNTVITIAHRLDTIVDYDKILVMEDGKIAESGNPAILLQQQDSKFQKMAKDAGLL